ncbi:MAG: hypothetical protein R3A52_24015 [Polyangiales bacterium]
MSESDTEAWRETVARVRSSPDWRRSPAFAELYALVSREAERVFRAFRGRAFDMDEAHDLLAERMTEILSAESPRAYFATALRRRLIDVERRARTRREAPRTEATDEAARRVPSPGTESGAERVAFVIDARAGVARLTLRERDVLVAVAEGEDRDALARALGTSRANIDQIVSRARQKLHAP